MKNKIFGIPPADFKTGGSGQLYKFHGICSPGERLASLEPGDFGIMFRKKAAELFGDAYEIVDPKTGNRVGNGK